MKLAFWGKDSRAIECLKAVRQDRHDVLLVIAASAADPLISFARELGYETHVHRDSNPQAILAELRRKGPDLSILAGFGGILSEHVFNMPRFGTINLHAGKLPEYRGSS